MACLRPSHAAIRHAQLHARMLRHSPKNRRHVLDRMCGNGQQAELAFRSLGHATVSGPKEGFALSKSFIRRSIAVRSCTIGAKQGLQERARGTRPHNDPYRARSGALYRVLSRTVLGTTYCTTRRFRRFPPYAKLLKVLILSGLIGRASLRLTVTFRR